ncbi:hypothetical protein BaRGS_00016161, partial [Batillaria attramentaria]
SCKTNYTCMGDVGGNPNYGFTNFDHIGWALLTSFQLLTLDYWEDIFLKITRTGGPSNGVFFIVIVFFGSYYLLNLMLARHANKISTINVRLTRLSRVVSRRQSAVSSRRISTSTVPMTWNTWNKSGANVLALDAAPLNQKLACKTVAFADIAGGEEAVVKIIALRRAYFADSWNVFDFTIVVVSVLDAAIQGTGRLSVMRTYRLLRLFRLALSWMTMRILLRITIDTMGELLNLTIVLSIIVFIFAVAGMKLFAKDYQTFDFGGSEAERWNFKDFFHSFLMVFRILCGEWVEPLWECMRAAGETCLVIFLPAVIIGNLMFLNLFLALLLNAFASTTIRRHKKQLEMVESHKTAQKFLEYCLHPCRKTPQEDEAERRSSFSQDEEERVLAALKLWGAVASEQSEDTELRPRFRASVTNLDITLFGSPVDPVLGSSVASDRDSPVDHLHPTFQAEGPDASDSSARHTQDTFSSAVPNTGTVTLIKSAAADDVEYELEFAVAETESTGSCEMTLADVSKTHVAHRERLRKPPLCFPKCAHTRSSWRKFRMTLVNIVDHVGFESAMLFLLFIQDFALAFEDVYLYQKPLLKSVLRKIDISLCAMFIVEMIMKWFGYGLTYCFTHFFTLLDFTVNVVSKGNTQRATVVSLYTEEQGVNHKTIFFALRTVRAVRPFRVAIRWHNMGVVVKLLIQVIPAIFNVFLVVSLFWFVFSVVGVHFFKGKFYKCVNASTGVALSYTVVPNRSYCEATGQRWENSKINFDNAAAGLLALFQVATFEGWMEVMQDAVDSTEIDEQPRFEASKYVAYGYFVAFIIFGSFFTLKLFISVIIDNYMSMKDKV